MTITLTKEELEEFQRKLREWHVKQVQFVMDNFWSVERGHLFDPRSRGGIEEVRALMARFERDNPIPDWRQLL